MGKADPATLRTAFDTTYAALFGRTIPRLEIEVVTWTLALAQRHERPSPSAIPRALRRRHRSERAASSNPKPAKSSPRRSTRAKTKAR